MPIEILAIGAHPDDIELTCGGTIAKATGEGRTVVIADLTKGELGTRGTPDIRAREAIEAAHLLGVKERRNVGIPDGNIEVSRDNVQKVMTLLRELRPRVLIIPHSAERHPDHVHAHQLIKEAWFYSGLKNLPTSLQGKTQEPYRAENYFEFMQWIEFHPSFIVDVSEVHEIKMKAIRAYSSQFHDPSSTEPQTKLSHPSFLDAIEVRSRYYGRRIGVQFGEPFYSVAPVGIRSLNDLVTDKA